MGGKVDLTCSGAAWSGPGAFGEAAVTPADIKYVTLAEGVTMMTNLVDCDLDAIRIGQRVRLVFKPTEGGPPVPTFTPA